MVRRRILQAYFAAGVVVPLLYRGGRSSEFGAANSKQSGDEGDSRELGTGTTEKVDGNKALR